jgi:hypothetical protein
MNPGFINEGDDCPEPHMRRSESVGADLEPEGPTTPFFGLLMKAIGICVALAVVAAIFGGVRP